MNETEVQDQNPEVAVPVTHNENSTQTQTSSPSLPDVGGMLQSALSFAWSRLDLLGWSFLMQIAIVLPFLPAGIYAGVSAVTGETFSNSEATVSVILATLGFIGMATLLTLNLGVLVYSISSEEKVGYWDGWRWTWSHFWGFVWVGFLVTIISFSSLALFIIPSIVVGVYLAFVMYVYVQEGERGMNALVRSTQLVYQNWWGVAGRAIAFALVGMIFALIGSTLDLLLFVPIISAVSGFGVGESIGILADVPLLFEQVVQTFVTVFTIFGFVLMYRSMKEQKPAFDRTAKSSARTIYTALAWLMIPFVVLTTLAAGYMVSMVLDQDGFYEELQYQAYDESQFGNDQDFFSGTNEPNSINRSEGEVDTALDPDALRRQIEEEIERQLEQANVPQPQ